MLTMGWLYKKFLLILKYDIEKREKYQGIMHLIGEIIYDPRRQEKEGKRKREKIV